MDEKTVQPYKMTIPYFILMAFNICIIGPIGVWLTKLYYKTGHDYLYGARRPKLVVFYNCFALFFVVLYIPLHIIFLELLWDNNGTYAEWWDTVSYNSMLTAVSISLSLRIWHSFYDFQLSHFSSRQWKSILSEDIRNEQEFFIFKYKHFLGLFNEHRI